MVVPGEDDGLLYAGGDPGVLFESRDGGASWELNKAFWEQPTRPEWSPGAGGMCMHSIATWPGDPSRDRARDLGGRRLALGRRRPDVAAREQGPLSAVHAGGGARGDDRPLRPQHAPRADAPERLFMQFHGGVYRSDDAGESWASIADGLPSDFGFPMVIDPDDPDSAYVIPLVADLDRTTPEGRVRVYETRDAGATWTAHGDGLPSEDAYLTILRQAFCGEGSGRRWACTSARRRATSSARRDAGRLVHGGGEPAARALRARRLEPQSPARGSGSGPA